MGKECEFTIYQLLKMRALISQWRPQGVGEQRLALAVLGKFALTSAEREACGYREVAGNDGQAQVVWLPTRPDGTSITVKRNLRREHVDALKFLLSGPEAVPLAARWTAMDLETTGNEVWAIIAGAERAPWASDEEDDHADPR